MAVIPDGRGSSMKGRKQKVESRNEGTHATSVFLPLSAFCFLLLMIESRFDPQIPQRVAIAGPRRDDVMREQQQPPQRGMRHAVLLQIVAMSLPGLECD